MNVQGQITWSCSCWWILCLAAISAGSATEHSEPAPTTTLHLSQGLAHVSSAQPLGRGRLCVGLFGNWYHQTSELTGAPPKGSQIFGLVPSFCFALNDWMDLFAVLPLYLRIQPSPDKNAASLGSVISGMDASIPMPPASPLLLGAQISFTGGTSGSQINTNREDGFNYPETRTGIDFSGRAMESLVVGDESLGFKVHLNEGCTFTVEEGHRSLLLLGAAMQMVAHPVLSFGLEANCRTNLAKPDILRDPFWLTPALQLRTPYHFNTVLGVDIRLSRARPAGQPSPALEPYRIFGGFVLTFDVLERKRREKAEEEEQIRVARQEAEKKAAFAAAEADSLARKAQLDSLAFAREREEVARKAAQDSIALAQAQQQLKEEKSKRSEAEQKLLTTGLLLLESVYFESGKSRVSINSRPYLTIIAKMLAKYPALNIEVTGHTDSRGRYDMNMNLSHARADAVRRFLVQVEPDLAGRITARGNGSSHPKADNGTAAGRQMNRRVELQVLNKEALEEYNPQTDEGK